MKQSNIILGIGIIVAVILLISSFFLKAEPVEKHSTLESEQSLSLVSEKIKNIAFTPIRTLAKHIIKINYEL